MSADSDPPRRAAPYVLPPFREKRPSGPGGKTWAAVGILILILLLAARAFMNAPRKLSPIFVRVADVGPSVYAPEPAAAPAPERPSADRMQVLPMSLPQPVERAAPPPLPTTPHIEGTRSEVIGYVPVLDLGVTLAAEPGFRRSYFWLSVKVDGAELPGFPKQLKESVQLHLPLPDRKLFQVLVTLRYSDRSFNLGHRYEVTPAKVDEWSILSKNVKKDARLSTITTALQDPLKRPFESHGFDPDSDRYSGRQ
jgi:hypothetical protein